MNRVDRLLALILYLQSRPLSTAEEMAAYFDRSLRTIYRDLAALGEAGVPLIGQAGMGYTLARGFHLPPVIFTPEEAASLVTGGLLVERSADASVSRPMSSALMKMRAVLPRPLQVQMLRLEKGMATTATTTPPMNAADLTLIQKALSECRVLRMSYQGWGQEAAIIREAEPLGLLYYLERWHLIAWCRLRNGLRDFRTDRMTRVSVLAETFEPREFSIQDYLQTSPAPELRAEVRFSALAADRARREWWLGIIAERETPLGPVLTLATVNWEPLAGWLLSFGEDVEVFSPDALRDQLVLAAKAAAAHHNTKPRDC